MIQPSIQVLFCANGAFFQHAAVTIASLLVNNRAHRFDLTVATDRHYAKEEAQMQALVDAIGNAGLRFVVFGLGRMTGLPIRQHWPLLAYMRLFAADIYGEEVDKILYLDTDLVVCRDIEDLWRVDMGTAPIAAAPDMFQGNPDYINTGVLLMNLKQWRTENAGAALIAYIEQHPALEYPDQDALNALFAGRILKLPLHWNFQARMAEAGAKFLGLGKREFRALRRDPGIVHYTTGSKPWMYRKDVHYAALYNHYLAMTPWRDYHAPDRTLRRRISRAVRLIDFRRKLRWIKAGL